MTQNNNIFFNADTLLLSLPLITLCTTYAYFKLIPLVIGIPLLGLAVVSYKMRQKILQRRAEQKMNEVIEETDIMKELQIEEEKKKNLAKAKSSKKEKKQQEKLRQRLQAEKKKESKQPQQNAQNANDDDDEGDELLTFVKGGRSNIKKKK